MRRDQISYLAGAIMTTLIGLGISSLVFSYVSDFTFFESCLIFFGGFFAFGGAPFVMSLVMFMPE